VLREACVVRVLVTGSAGWLGQAIVPRLVRARHFVIGIDPVAAETTHGVGSIEIAGSSARCCAKRVGRDRPRRYRRALDALAAQPPVG